MLKSSSKISKLSAYIVLLGYLTITTANVFHYHNFDLGNPFSSLISSKKKQTSHFSFSGSDSFCLIHFAYSALNNSLISVNYQNQNYKVKPDFVEQSLVSQKPSKVIIYSFCLRAPPISIS